MLSLGAAETPVVTPFPPQLIYWMITNTANFGKVRKGRFASNQYQELLKWV